MDMAIRITAILSGITHSGNHRSIAPIITVHTITTTTTTIIAPGHIQDGVTTPIITHITMATPTMAETLITLQEIMMVM